MKIIEVVFEEAVTFPELENVIGEDKRPAFTYHWYEASHYVGYLVEEDQEALYVANGYDGDGTAYNLTRIPKKVIRKLLPLCKEQTPQT